MGLIHGARRTRAFAIVAAIAFISMLAIGQRGALALIQQLGNSASPATGHAEVIAQGVATLPDAESAWRVTGETAGAWDSTEPETRDLGFVLASDSGIVINDYTGGGQSRLAPGEAAFGVSGAYQSRAALSGNNTGYLQISLIDSGSANQGNDVRYAGDSFASPDGRRDLDLVRDVLADGEETTINAGSAPSLLYVLSGDVTVDDGNSTQDLGDGDGATINGAFSVQANGPAVIVAAVIGDEVPAPPRISGTVTLDVRLCPDDITEEQLTKSVNDDGSTDLVDKCTALEDPVKSGFAISLRPADGAALPLTSARQTSDAGVLVWENLAFGDYTLSDILDLPDGYGDAAMSNGNLNIGDHSAFTLNRDNPDAYRVIYLFKAPAAGSISITYHVCEVANADEFDRDNCVTYPGGFTTQVMFGSDGVYELADAKETGEATYTWDNLVVATGEDPQPGDPGYYGLNFPDAGQALVGQEVVDGAELVESPGSYSVKLTPEHPTAKVDYYLVNVVGATAGNIYIVGIPCPSTDASLTDCDVNGSIQLPSVTIPLASGSAVDQGSAVASGDAYVWTELGLDDTYTISSANIVPPDGYTIRTIVQYQTGEAGDAFDVTLTQDAPNADFIVYLDPIVPDEGEGTPSGG